MEPDVGIVCGECDLWSPPGTEACPSCSRALALWDEPAAAPTVDTRPLRTAPSVSTFEASDLSALDLSAIASLEERSSTPPVLVLEEDETLPPPPPAESEPPTQDVVIVGPGEEPMEQARSYICKSCHSQVPPGHKFCGRCGTPMPTDVAGAKTSFFGAMQTPGKAKLVLIRGEGLDGISYHLNSVEHAAGRSQGAILFPDDATLSPKHANFFYRDGKLFVRDEGSLNGVYARVRGSVPIEPSDVFMSGLQYFRLELTPKPADAPDPDGTYFYSSPKRPSAFRVVHVLRTGPTGMVYCARENVVAIGREGSEMNFPGDPYMSGKHAKIEAAANNKFTLTDMGSKNGTFLRIHRERELVHGDYVFLGRQLLRVEITP
jgi:pSer/pThr/pTyr-binding forkhead associated (FHA) protein